MEYVFGGVHYQVLQLKVLVFYKNRFILVLPYSNQTNNDTLMAKDYIPRPNADFNVFQKNLVDKAVDKELEWNLPSADVTELAADSATYGNHYKIISRKSNCTTTQRAAHDHFREGFEKK